MKYFIKIQIIEENAINERIALELKQEVKDFASAQDILNSMFDAHP